MKQTMVFIYKTAFAIAAMLLWQTNAEAQHWYKGNLHTHTLWSDGNGFPEVAADFYKTNGYHFLSLTEHNILMESEKWMTVPGGHLTRDAYDRYQAKFGAAHVDTQVTANGALRVRLKTLEEVRAMYEEPGRFLLIQGEEITSQYSGQPIHVNGINIQKLIPRQYGSNKTEVMQHAIYSTVNQGKKLGITSFPILNHPNFHWAVTAKDMQDLQQARFFEVHNAIYDTHSYGGPHNDSAEVIWDKVNLHYLKHGRPLMFGVGNDDTHSYYQFAPSHNNPGRAWVVVNAPRLDAESIAIAMLKGDFYASTGVALKELASDKQKISLKVAAETGVVYTIQFIGAKQGDEKTRILKEITGTEATYVLDRTDLLVRVRILSSKLKKDTAYVGDYETAWTQPVSPYAVPYKY